MAGEQGSRLGLEKRKGEGGTKPGGAGGPMLEIDRPVLNLNKRQLVADKALSLSRNRRASPSAVSTAIFLPAGLYVAGWLGR